ncbi:MAG TPA: histone deacetylase [Nocardioides sp.]|nr:histone deacetylase [Nocardioides sp.]
MDVWYASYGSNMSADRLACYLTGGCPPGGTRTYPGARDRTLPTAVRPLQLAGCVYFAWHSRTWGGGIAFYDPDGPGSSVGRAYRLNPGQLSDVLEQEMHRDPGVDHDLSELLAEGVTVLGDGRYESLHVVGELDGEPVVTFTSPEAMHAADHNEPTSAYLALMARGLVEGHAWDADRVAAYLLNRPGIGSWDAAGIRRLVDPR